MQEENEDFLQDLKDNLLLYENTLHFHLALL